MISNYYPEDVSQKFNGPSLLQYFLERRVAIAKENYYRGDAKTLDP